MRSKNLGIDELFGLVDTQGRGFVDERKFKMWPPEMKMYK